MFEIDGRLGPEQAVEAAQAEIGRSPFDSRPSIQRSQHFTNVERRQSTASPIHGMSSMACSMFMFAALIRLMTGFILLVGCATLPGSCWDELRLVGTRWRFASKMAPGADA